MEMPQKAEPTYIGQVWLQQNPSNSLNVYQPQQDEVV